MFYFNADKLTSIDPQTLVGMAEQDACDLLTAHGVEPHDWASDVAAQAVGDVIDGKALDGRVRVPYRLGKACTSHGKVTGVHTIDQLAEAAACVLVSLDGPLCDAVSLDMWDLTPDHNHIDTLEFEA